MMSWQGNCVSRWGKHLISIKSEKEHDFLMSLCTKLSTIHRSCSVARCSAPVRPVHAWICLIDSKLVSTPSTPQLLVQPYYSAPGGKGRSYQFSMVTYFTRRTCSSLFFPILLDEHACCGALVSLMSTISHEGWTSDRNSVRSWFYSSWYLI